MIAEWRGYIQKRNNGSEMVNYNEPDFPSYVHRGYVFPSSSWANDPHYHDDVEILSVTGGFMAYNINGEEVFLEEGDTIFVNSKGEIVGESFIGSHSKEEWEGIIRDYLDKVKQ